MSMTIAGYQVKEKLYKSRNSLVYRAYHEAENRTVILKILRQAYPPPKIIATFRREYELICSLQSPGVICAYGLTADQNRPVLVLEDFGGESLAQFIQTNGCTLFDALSLAIHIADVVGQVHQQQIIHKDVNPTNIVWNPRTGQLKLIDFGIATRLSHENPILSHPTGLEGTLAYMSPEQTGRMNRVVDYRTDFYSLGVTLYEMVTGRLPFPTTDALALVHAHIAQQPTPPHELAPVVPQTLSSIVMKLMAKNAEDRYQSAEGLVADLKECLRQWRTTGRIEPLLLGQQDVTDRFYIPQKLYGRETEVATLLAAFERVSEGSSEIILVSGHAGIGKSALVREVYKPITQKRGYFASGKFDQFHRDIPYESLTLAFQALLRQLLTESEDQIGTWRKKLLAALGPNGQVIVDVIPELELLVGPQLPVPSLPPTETQNRFQLTFQNFVHAFAQPSHPLVLFLDDLQWADAASLNLLQLLITASENHYLLVVGAYRDNEMRATHPLQPMLDEIHKGRSVISHIAVGPLSLRDIEQLIADTLSCTLDKVKSLAEVVLTKTAGNPFFVYEFLKSLYTGRLLTFDAQGGWQWDATRIKAQDITDNVVELMSGKMQKLPEGTQTTLKLAACIGNQFALRTLAIICEKSPLETVTDLWPAITEGLVVPLGNTYTLAALDVQGLTDEVMIEYKFAHDRVQQAAYSLVPQADKQVMHQQVGRLLLQNIPLKEREHKIFDIVNHLNMGRSLIQQQAEREELAAFNLMAGRKAKAAAAYEPALRYLQVGLDLLPEDAWERNYDLALTVYLETAEVAYLNANFEQMERLSEKVLKQAKTLLDKVRIYEVNLHACTARNKLPEGITTGLKVLELLGVRFPEKPSQMDIQHALEETKFNLADKAGEELLNLREMTDPYQLAAIRILSGMVHFTKIGSPDLFPLVVCSAVNLSVKYGNTPLSAQVYAAYGLILCGVVGDLDGGYQFGKLALDIIERFHAKELKTNAIVIVALFIQPWKEHIGTTLRPILEGYEIGLETGDLNFAALSIFGYIFNAYWIGRELSGIEREIGEYNETIKKLKKDFILDLNGLYRQIVLNLLGRSEDPCSLIGESYDEEQMLPLWIDMNNRNVVCHIYLNKLILHYLFQSYTQAINYAIRAEEYLDGLSGTVAIPPFHMYDSLTRLAVFFDIQEFEREHVLEKIAANQKKMALWAQHAPMNYLHKFYLVEAEKARVLGKDLEAREFYDNAITLAHENEYLNEEALAYELAGRFYLARGQSHLARYYLHDARYAYLRWGALAKVQDLEKNYPQFFETQIASDLHQPNKRTSITGTEQPMSTTLDAWSVLKASQTLTSEIVLDRLLTKLMKIVIENAGAQRGILILEKAGQLVLEAEGEIDKDDAIVLQAVPVETSRDVPMTIVHYVERTKETVVLSEATQEDVFATDPYITRERPKSILCAPLVTQGKLIGIVYLENNLAAGVFTSERVEILNLLSAEMAISIENARLYQSLEEANERLADHSKTLEQKVEERTQALQEKNWELEIANQQVQEASRRQSQFLAGMSHELRTPMNAILGFTRLVLRRAGDLLPERQRDNLVKVQESANHLLNLINQLLDLSRLGSGRVETRPGLFGVKQCILACCEMVSPLVKPGVQLTQDIAEAVGEAYLDEEGVRHVVINLLSNAIKFTDAGEVVVRVRALGQANGNASLVITVADTGVGIPADALDTIFEEFQQVEGGVQKREGTGLGLPIARRWVELLGGSIKVESELGKGSTFIVSLPVVYREQEISTESISQ